MGVFALLMLPYLIEAQLVGIALASVRGRLGAPESRWATIVALVLTFALLDTYLFGVIASLQIRVWIGNKQVADALNIMEPVSGHELFSVNFTDVFVWAAQTLVAAWMAAQFNPRPREAVAPPDANWRPQTVPFGFIKSSDGVTYYPFGFFGRGRVVPAPATLDRIHRSDRRLVLMYLLSSTAYLALVASLGAIGSFAAIPALALYWLGEFARHRGTYVDLESAPRVELGRFARTMPATRLYVGTLGALALTTVAWWYWWPVPLIFSSAILTVCCVLVRLRVFARTE